MTVGGFTQPSVARNLWDQQASIEKGLPQRFLWLIPQPYFSTFDSLEPLDGDFYDSLGKYVPRLTVFWYIHVPQNVCTVKKEYFIHYNQMARSSISNAYNVNECTYLYKQGSMAWNTVCAVGEFEHGLNMAWCH